MADVLVIEFDDRQSNPHAVYRSGKLVCLKVLVQARKSFKCQAIQIRLDGHSKVSFYVSRGRSSRTVVSEEKYINETFSLFTAPSDGPEAGHHPAGDFVYPLSFLIPPEAPSSFAGGENSHVTYKVHATVERGTFSINQTAEAEVLVVRDFDLNSCAPCDVGPFSQELRLPVKCCGCCNCCGRLTASISIPKRGYLVGETIMIEASITNSSNVILDDVTFALVQVLVLNAQGEQRSERRQVSLKQMGRLMVRSKVAYSVPLEVMPVNSSNLEGCGNIAIGYCIMMYAKGGCCVDLDSVICNVAIGTIPLSSDQAGLGASQVVVTEQPVRGQKPV